MWKMKICKVVANLVLKIHSFFFSGVSDRGILTFYLVSFAGGGTCGKWESSVIPSTKQCSKAWSHSYVRMQMLLAFKALLVLPAWLLLAPHPSCGDTSSRKDSSSRKDTAPPRSCCFSHWKWFITPHSMRACVREVDWELVLAPHCFWSFACGGQRHTCTSEEKRVAHIAWPDRSHQGLLLGREKLLFLVDMCVFTLQYFNGLQRWLTNIMYDMQ